MHDNVININERENNMDPFIFVILGLITISSLTITKAISNTFNL